MNHQSQQEPVISLQLPLSAVNTLLQGAAQLPYGVVAGLVAEVQEQAQAQLQASAAEAGPQPG